MGNVQCWYRGAVDWRVVLPRSLDHDCRDIHGPSCLLYRPQELCVAALHTGHRQPRQGAGCRVQGARTAQVACLFPACPGTNAAGPRAARGIATAPQHRRMSQRLCERFTGRIAQMPEAVFRRPEPVERRLRHLPALLTVAVETGRMHLLRQCRLQQHHGGSTVQSLAARSEATEDRQTATAVE